jgi:hypothetical protein
MTAPLDPEIKAMRAVGRAIQPLDDEQMRRVVLWLTAWWFDTTQDEVWSALHFRSLRKSDPWTGIPMRRKELTDG